jgi:integrase/recombinase XerD
MEKVMELEEEECYSNARLYKQAAVLLAKFNLERYKANKLLLRNLTPDFLRAFQKWALSTNYIVDQKKKANSRTYSVTTIGMYLIRIKAIVNGCVDSGDLHQARNPFGRKKFTIPKSRVSKRPLDLSEIKLLANYETEDKREQFARDIFIFSYLANGMNFYDIFKLKWSDIRNDEFRFVRQKTFSKLPDKQIRVFLNEKLISIIERHGTDKNENGYIFNIVPWGASKMEEEKRIRSTIATVNPQLKKIATTIGINPEISTYYARHSFATVMHELGASIITLKNVIGHEDIKSTQVYIGYDKKERLIELQNRLLEE